MHDSDDSPLGEKQFALYAEPDLPPRTAADPPARPDRMLQFFRYDHLPEPLRAASAPFCQLAQYVVDVYPQNAERTVCLRKLLEAKDAAVRTRLYKE